MPSPTPTPPHVSLALVAHRRPLLVTSSSVFVLCRITNDAGAEVEQGAVRLVVALDRSGSMAGEKLRAAQATLGALVDELGPDDRLAVVAFDDRVDVVVPPTSMTASAKAVVRSALPAIAARGGTDLSAALLRSLALARDGGGAKPWHVIVLTDGAPTSGVTNEDALLTLAGGALGSMTLSTFGYGGDVRSELLGRMSDLGRGHYHFVEGREPPVLAFASELGRQRDTLGVEVGLRLRPGRGVTLAAVPRFARAGAVMADGAIDLSLGPLLAGDTLSLVVALAVAPEALALASASPWLGAKLTYRAVADGQLHAVEAGLVPLLGAQEGPWVAEVARELVMQRAGELIHSAASTPAAELGEYQVALAALVREAGVGGDPDVASALALLAQTVEGLAEEGTRASTATRAASLSRGLYHKEVTAPGIGQKRVRTLLFADRLTQSMGGPPPDKPGKPEGN